MKSDIEIAKSTNLEDIYCIAKKAGINEDEVIPWGAFKAKISFSEASKLIISKTNLAFEQGGPEEEKTFLKIKDSLHQV